LEALIDRRTRRIVALLSVHFGLLVVVGPVAF